MINLTTSVVGDEESAARFKNVGDSIRARIREALSRIGEQVAAGARAAAPVATGELRGSIHALYAETLTTQKAIVKADAIYARFLEHGVVMHGGTHNKREKGGKRVRLSRLHELRSQGIWRIQPRPFMSQAIAAIRGQIDSDIEAAVNAATEGG